MDEGVNLNSEQQMKLNSFLAEHPEANEKTALKFLIGRKWDLERVRTLYANFCQTVKERNLSQVTLPAVLAELRTQKMYIPGSRAKDGSILFVIWANRHVPGQFSMEDTIKTAFYLSQVQMSSLEVVRKGLCLLINLEGLEWANSDVNFVKGVINFFTDNVPAAVKHIIVWRAPWWISILLKIITPFLKEKMRQRLVITDDPADMRKIVDQEEIPGEFPGGTFRYDHLRYLEEELSKISNNQTKLVPPPLDSSLTESLSPQLQLIGEDSIMIDKETAKALVREREEMLAVLEAEIRTRLQAMDEKKINHPLDLAQLASTRRGRLSLPVDALIGK